MMEIGIGLLMMLFGWYGIGKMALMASAKTDINPLIINVACGLCGFTGAGFLMAGLMITLHGIIFVG